MATSKYHKREYVSIMSVRGASNEEHELLIENQTRQVQSNKSMANICITLRHGTKNYAKLIIYGYFKMLLR